MAFFTLLNKSVNLHPSTSHFPNVLLPLSALLSSVSLCFIDPYPFYSFAMISVGLGEIAKTSMFIYYDVQEVVKLHL